MLFAIAAFEGYYPGGPDTDIRAVFPTEAHAMGYVRAHYRKLARRDFVQLLRISVEDGVEVLLSDDNLFAAARVNPEEED